jgi:hypothetical protein
MPNQEMLRLLENRFDYARSEMFVCPILNLTMRGVKCGMNLNSNPRDRDKAVWTAGDWGAPITE